MDLSARIAQDVQDYKGLCERYGEPVCFRGWWVDCYGSHAKHLQARELADAMREARNREH